MIGLVYSDGVKFGDHMTSHVQLIAKVSIASITSWRIFRYVLIKQGFFIETICSVLLALSRCNVHLQLSQIHEARVAVQALEQIAVFEHKRKIQK